jgi:aminopeptidase YwaD
MDGCPDALGGLIRQTFAAHPGLIEGPPWFQGDHFLFLMHQVPAVVITSERVEELMANIVHTERDTPEVLDLEKLAGTAGALRDLIMELGR